MIASGTNGTCTWSIDDSGNLTVRPTSGMSGYLLRGMLLFSNDLPWGPYADRIKTITFSGSIRIYQETYGGGVEETGDARQMFDEYYNSGEKTWVGYTLLTEITGLSCLKGLTNMFHMFESCVALPYIDLTGVDTSYVKDMDYMFNNCDLLTSVKLSNTFDTSLAKENGKKDPAFGKGTNQTNGIVIQNDADFMDLTPAEHAGTWQRNVAPIFKAEAYRSENGTADEDGNDATFKITWASQASTTTRSLKIYKKLNSASSYPATPDVNETLSGNSGVEQVTIASLGDDAYDFKVVFYDGVNTFIAFPAVKSNVRLITIDEKGRVECGDYGGNLKSIFDIFYPVGSYYETSLPDAIPSGESTPTDTDLANLGTTWFNPKYAWGGEWSLETAGLVHVSGATNHAKYPVSSTYTDANNGAGKKQDGNEDAIVPKHDHPITRTTDVAVTVTKSVSNADSITGGSHGHKIKYNPNTGASGSARHVLSASGSSETSSNATSSDTHTHSVPKHAHSTSVTQPVFDVGDRGVDGTGKNMQPYINVYRWHRVA